MGIRRTCISTRHPRANGMVERYNGIIESGFRRMKSVCPDGTWHQFLPEIVAGLRMLPSSLGYSPFLIIYK